MITSRSKCRPRNNSSMLSSSFTIGPQLSKDQCTGRAGAIRTRALRVMCRSGAIKPLRGDGLEPGQLARLVSAYHSGHAGLGSVDGAACRGEKKPPSKRFLSAFPKSGICSPCGCGAAGKIWNISCSGLIGEGGTNFSHSSSTTENEAPCFLPLSYNCSTRSGALNQTDKSAFQAESITGY